MSWSLEWEEATARRIVGVLRDALRDPERHYRELAERLRYNPKCRELLDMLMARRDRLVVVEAWDAGSLCTFSFVPLQYARELIRLAERGAPLAGRTMPVSELTYNNRSDWAHVKFYDRFDKECAAQSGFCSERDGDYCEIRVDCERRVAMWYLTFKSDGFRKLMEFFDKLMPV